MHEVSHGQVTSDFLGWRVRLKWEPVSLGKKKKKLNVVTSNESFYSYLYNGLCLVLTYSFLAPKTFWHSIFLEVLDVPHTLWFHPPTTTGRSSDVGVQVRGHSALQKHRHTKLSEVLNAEEFYRDHSAGKEAHVRDTGHWTCKNNSSISEKLRFFFSPDRDFLM